MGSELPSHTSQHEGRLASRSISFFQGSLGLIYVASILSWGHFWQSLYAWCQRVKDHEHILFQDHWSRNSHQTNSAGFQVSTESCLQETFFKKNCSLLQPKETFFLALKLIRLPPSISFPRAAVWIEERLGSFPNSTWGFEWKEWPHGFDQKYPPISQAMNKFIHIQLA